MNFFYTAFTFLLILNTATLKAQDLLTLEAATQKMLSNNFDIRIAQKDTLISENNITRGNAGFLPDINLTGRANGSLNDTRLLFLDGRTQEVNGAQTRQQNVSLGLDWVIFDGLRMFNNYKLLQLTHQFSKIDLRFAIENALRELYVTYHQIILQQKVLELLAQNLQVSRERLEVAYNRYELGAFSKADWLRAKVDFNSDSAQVINQEQLVFQSKATLNQLVGEQPSNVFVTTDTILFNLSLDYEELKTYLAAENTQTLAARQLQVIRQKEVLLAEGNQLPTLALDAGYSFFNSVSDAGFVVSNRNQGFTYGLTLTYPIFNGANRKRETQNARIRLNQSEEQLSNAQLAANTTFEINYQNYLRQKDLLGLEQANVEVVRQNLDIAIERYKLGLVSAIEFRDAQLVALQAENRLISLQFQLKLSEIELLRISGALVRGI